MVKSPTTPFLLLFSLIAAVACEGDGDSKLKFEGVLLKDEVNNPLGTMGIRDLADWQNDMKLDQKIMDLLDFDDDADLTGTGVADDVYIAAYPNPASNNVNIAIEPNTSSLVKLIIVNEDLEVLHLASFTGGQTTMFDVSDNQKFPDRKIVRVYYSVSSKDNENYFVGHGDVWICRGECH